MTNFKRKKNTYYFLLLSLLLINKIISFNIFLVEKINKNVVQMSRLGGKSAERNVYYKRADAAQKVALACWQSTDKVKRLCACVYTGLDTYW